MRIEEARDTAGLLDLEAPIAASPEPLRKFFPIESANYSVEVIPDGQGGADFRYNGMNQLTIPVDGSHFGLIQLKLETGSGSFLTSPICWISTAPGQPGAIEPIPAPAELRVVRHADDHLSILDLDPGVGKTFSFLVSVALDGKVYTSSDPTIINHPDPPPGV